MAPLTTPTARCAVARNRFTKKEWEAIQRGPLPFTDREQAIVAARKRFHWNVFGVAANEDWRFSIQ
jgi:hypothetical protein